LNLQHGLPATLSSTEHMRTVRLLIGTLASALFCAACVQRVEVRPAPGTGVAVSRTFVLEQFLRASNAAAASDTSGIVTMGRLFGTKAGPTTGVDSRKIVEQRMYLIASILRHDDYRILGEQLVPGRLQEARQINVEMTMGPRKVTVPFTMVRTSNDGWLVENIELEIITAKK
jgi:hypothetical protein